MALSHIRPVPDGGRFLAPKILCKLEWFRASNELATGVSVNIHLEISHPGLPRETHVLDEGAYRERLCCLGEELIGRKKQTK
jgi:hypothetical protein